jgi:diguanylate cyclase (GGDEF)-like protein/PAS domain S-box-containing protein
MGVQLSRAESSELYRLLAEDTGDIVIKTDRDGFILDASPAIARLGVVMPEMLIGPHISDLVDPGRANQVRRSHQAVVTGQHSRCRIEFPAPAHLGETCWFELNLRGLAGSGGAIQGAIGLLRDIGERKLHEQVLFAAKMTDPLTGLTNRRAFLAMLEHMIDGGQPGCLALIDIDHFKAINLKYGHSAGDEVLVLFAEFVRERASSNVIVSRVDGESLSLLMPGASATRAAADCRQIVGALGELHLEISGKRLAITASAGVARIDGTPDAVVRRAEMALFLAKAKGRNRLESDCVERLVTGLDGASKELSFSAFGH